MESGMEIGLAPFSPLVAARESLGAVAPFIGGFRA